jgi:hypothetical protein
MVIDVGFRRLPKGPGRGGSSYRRRFRGPTLGYGVDPFPYQRPRAAGLCDGRRPVYGACSADAIPMLLAAKRKAEGEMARTGFFYDQQ